MPGSVSQAEARRMLAVGDGSPTSSTATRRRRPCAPRATARKAAWRPRPDRSRAWAARNESEIAAPIGRAANRLWRPPGPTRVRWPPRFRPLAIPPAAPGPTGRPCEAPSTEGCFGRAVRPGLRSGLPEQCAERVSRSCFRGSPAVPSAGPGHPSMEGGRLAAAALSVCLMSASGYFCSIVNSCVCGFRWPSFLAPATALSLRFQTMRPRVMSDS
jgi:hypothetical protein